MNLMQEQRGAVHLYCTREKTSEIIYIPEMTENIMTYPEQVILEQTEIKVGHTCSEMAGERKRFYPHRISS